MYSWFFFCFFYCRYVNYFFFLGVLRAIWAHCRDDRCCLHRFLRGPSPFTPTVLLRPHSRYPSALVRDLGLVCFSQPIRLFFPRPHTCPSRFDLVRLKIPSTIASLYCRLSCVNHRKYLYVFNTRKIRLGDGDRGCPFPNHARFR